ncbi:SsrA-binding protein [Candidatus Giovannonibacteria bacterium RIFCSPLOWO2_12_FULL_44_25]|uniref:SsrA-binding protein n=3 Tax=Parcubacteria group TaxID=1794811 RepID=A0A837IKN9_9BACT|nr:MAG: SsrA-binding protein [Parcubacteria group bacterium GW2011_GWC1_44_10]KKT60116.1 MAG: SsrA-binding protein [Candidatus Giovannonibacteria bacterium GW2011_GWA1_44_25]KKU12861.1 MAG: SsrA-binding protein [Candidatus Azambacteria bacterium GW2011_GWC2_45_7b]KKU29963.1 MAG: SsrA-binding protein [Candidatus Giovannonibacteria bacterium GW2011_GWB1_46_20]OGF49321.1 MAG: SsrA-binding protein [Candidatus Giovannonibacteria bacterium GWA2_45_15]OGF59781.1 MAG: SsrA-binding protein [Candidatus 
MQYLKYMALFAENRKARFEFEILETLEAGLELFGFEVKAVRNHKMSLEGSYVFPKRGDFYLVGATIAPYQPKNTPKDYEQARERRLLLHKKEINYLIGKATTKGLTILPLRVYTKGARIKLEIAVARRLKKHDRRERIKEREDKRKIERTLKEL